MSELRHLTLRALHVLQGDTYNPLYNGMRARPGITACRGENFTGKEKDAGIIGATKVLNYPHNLTAEDTVTCPECSVLWDAAVEKHGGSK